MYRLLVALARARHDFDHLRDHFSGALYHYFIADPEPEASYLVEIVQRGAGDGHAAAFYRFEFRDRGDGPGAAHRELDVLHRGGGLLGRIFKGYGPARALGRETEQPPLPQRIHFNDQTVYLVGQAEALLRIFSIKSQHLFGAPADPVAQRGDIEAQAPADVQVFPVRVRLDHAFKVAVGMGDELEPASRRHRRVFLPQRPGRGVPRVHKRFFAGGERLFVKDLEILLVHVDFAPRLEQGRGMAEVQPDGHGLNSAHVQRDVFARFPVAPRGGPGESAVLIFYGAGKAVDLRLHRHFEGLVFKAFFHARVPLQEFPGGIAVVERKHGNAVRHGSEGVGALAAHAPRRGIIGGELRVGGFQRFKAGHQRVELAVGDLRRVRDVIKALVPPYFGPERLYFNAGIPLNVHLTRLFCRAMPSSTPLTNLPDFSVEYFFASSMASSIMTATGASESIIISHTAMRSIERSMAGIRSISQLRLVFLIISSILGMLETVVE